MTTDARPVLQKLADQSYDYDRSDLAKLGALMYSANQIKKLAVAVTINRLVVDSRKMLMSWSPSIDPDGAPLYRKRRALTTVTNTFLQNARTGCMDEATTVVSTVDGWSEKIRKQKILEGRTHWISAIKSDIWLCLKRNATYAQLATCTTKAELRNLKRSLDGPAT